MGAVAPLKGLRVIDIGFGHAAALIAKFLAEAGASVVRFEPANGDPFRMIYPADKVWRAALTEVRRADRGQFARLTADADILVSGGERIEGASFGALFDGIDLPGQLIRLQIAPGLPGGPFAACDGADLLIQAETGIVFETFADCPIPMAISPSVYGGVFQGLAGVCAALLVRERSGRGQTVEVGLAEAAVTMMAPLWSSAESEPPWFLFRIPKGARPLILECADGGRVQVVLGSIGSKYKLYRLLGIDDASVLPGDAGLPNPEEPPERFFGDLDKLAPMAARWKTIDLLDALRDAGIAAGRVLAPGDLWDEPQVTHNGIISSAVDGGRYVGQPVRWTQPSGDSTRGRARAESGPLPLSGLRVIDFGAFVAGPSAAVGLADLGAEVIKVEPITGDPLRSSYLFFAAANRGKKSIALNLKSPAGLRIAAQLTRSADVVCSNFKEGAAQRLGIDPITLHNNDRSTIVLLNSGYGLSGPLAAAPAFDPVMQAECGLEFRSGGEGNSPILNPTTPIDFGGGYLGQIGVLMALFHRARRGSGMAVEVPLLNAAMFLIADVVKLPNGTCAGPLTLSNDRTGFNSAERIYRAHDGWIAVSARTRSQSEALVKLAGLEIEPEALGLRRTKLQVRKVERWFAACGVADALEMLGRNGVPAVACNAHGRKAILESTTLANLGAIYETQRPQLGATRGCGIAYCLSDTALRPLGSVPGLGENAPQILAELGYGPAEIASLRESGIVKTA